MLINIEKKQIPFEKERKNTPDSVDLIFEI